MLAAIRRASSRVSGSPRGAPAGLLLEVKIGERVAVVVFDDEAGGIRLSMSHARREAAGRHRGRSSLYAPSESLCVQHHIEAQARVLVCIAIKGAQVT